MRTLILRSLQHDLLRAALLSGAAIGAGFAVNLLRADPLTAAHTPRSERLDAALSRLEASLGAAGNGVATKVDAAAVAAVLGDARVLILDVRPDLFFEDGHIPGAMNFPRELLGKEYARLRVALNGAKLTVVYCAGSHCEEAEAMAGALTRLGHRNIAVYQGGWDEWSAQGRPVEKNPVE